MKLGKVVAHIPARGGSKRVPAKNLRYLAGRPMIGYAIETALKCPRLDEVYVNTDSERIAAYAQSMGCRVYMRPAHLGSDDATGDEVDRVGDAVPDEVPADWWSGPSDDVQAGTPRANDNRDNGIREIPVRPPEPVLPPASEGRHDALVQPLLGPPAAADEVTAPAPPAPEPGAHRRRGSGGSIWVPWRRRSSPPEDDDAAGEPPTPWPSLSQGAGGEPLEASSLDDRPQPIDDPLVTEPPGTRPGDRRPGRGAAGPGRRRAIGQPPAGCRWGWKTRNPRAGSRGRGTGAWLA